MEDRAKQPTTIRIAVATDDGEEISNHFGQAAFYRVFQVEDGRRTDLGLRPKAHHTHGDHQPSLHGSMIDPIADCHILLAGGMGVPAWEKARSAGLQVILAGGKIEDALKAYVSGALTSDERRLHQHRH
jgi:predicted Fe-Mo cluster-binding NifX family protein